MLRDFQPSVVETPMPGLYVYRRFLPHWRIDRAVYFVTCHLCPGQDPLTVLERDQLAQILRHFDGGRYELFAYVVMSDHVHTLVQPVRDYSLARIVHSWKSYSTRLLQRGPRCGRIWRREYFDRVIRSESDFDEKLNYILDNPYRRWPGIDTYPWVWCREDLVE